MGQIKRFFLKPLSASSALIFFLCFLLACFGNDNTLKEKEPIKSGMFSTDYLHGKWSIRQTGNNSLAKTLTIYADQKYDWIMPNNKTVSGEWEQSNGKFILFKAYRGVDFEVEGFESGLESAEISLISLDKDNSSYKFQAQKIK